MNAQEKLLEGTFAPAFAAPGPGYETGAANALDIKIGKTVIRRESDGALTEVFTLTLGGEAIQLLPLKTWAQLDAFKWRARGILPGTPAGLEIRWDHVKVAGETVSPWDPDACARLEKAFSEWLARERQALQSVKEKPQPGTSNPPAAEKDEDALHFQLDKSTTAAQPQVKCLEGNRTIKVVALNLQGLNALIEQGLMRRPGTLKAGALHDWVELDGEVFRFSDGNGLKSLENTLNDRYIAAEDPNAPPDVMVFENPASPTGFDIQFPAIAGGVFEIRKRHLDEDTVHLLQDPEHCRVLRKEVTAKLIPPNLLFKVKMPDGGERNLESGANAIISAASANGAAKAIDLSQPINLLEVGLQELTAVFNHPAINRRAHTAELAKSRAG